MARALVRRDILKCALASAVAIPALGSVAARAAGLTPLDPTDPTAHSLGFVADSSKAGQRCGVCMQYQGAPTDTRAACSIYPRHSVPVNGWCSAFAQRS
jgi:hypothetical protein